MNRLRQFCAATVLTLVLVFTVFAGDMATGYVQPPPQQQQSAFSGDMATGDTATNLTPITGATYIDPVTGHALSILQSLLSLF
jgi:hypothetical protein